MFPYWFLFAVFAFGAIISMRGARMPAFGFVPATLAPAGPGRAATHHQPASGAAAAAYRSYAANSRGLFIASLVPIILIGFRYYVGTDYLNYVAIFKRISRLSFSSAIGQSDVGYAVLNWIVAQLGADLWLVNLVCAVLFVHGLVQFAKVQPNPWLAITIAVPYLVITVGMGLSRQAVAIGLGMAGLAAVSKGSFPKFVAYVLAGALFHRTALVLLPIVTVAYSRNRLVAISVGLFGSLLGYYVLTSGGGFEGLQKSYITHVIGESQGASFRLGMNIPPAILFLLFIKRFSPDPHERLTYVILSIISFISLVLLMLFPAASTAIDRMSLYVIPLQLYVFSRLPSVFPDSQGNPSGTMTLALVLYSALVEFVWLNYAVFARDWVPYHFYPGFFS